MIFAPILSLIFMVLGTGFFMTFVSLHLRNSGLGDFQIGLTQSAFYLGMLLSSLRSERLISRVGHIRSLTATCGLLGAATLVLFVIPSPHWFWFRFIAGACVGAFYIAVESWLLVEFPSNRRGVALAYYTISIYAAQSLSQLFLSINGLPLQSAYIVSAILISLAVIPVSIGSSGGPQVTTAEPESLFKFLKLSPLGVAGCFLGGMILSSLYSYMPLFIEARGFQPGLVMAIMIAGGALLQYPIGKMSDYLERRKLLVGLGAVGFVLVMLMSLVGIKVLFYFTIFAMGGLLFTIYPVSMALGCDCVEQRDIVKMTGVLLFAYGCGSVLGPVLTPVMQPIGDSFVLVMVGFYCVFLSSVGIYALNYRRRIKIKDQTQFNVIPTGPIVEDFYPQTGSETRTDVEGSANGPKNMDQQRNNPGSLDPSLG